MCVLTLANQLSEVEPTTRISVAPGVTLPACTPGTAPAMLSEALLHAKTDLLVVPTELRHWAEQCRQQGLCQAWVEVVHTSEHAYAALRAGAADVLLAPVTETDWLHCLSKSPATPVKNISITARQLFVKADYKIVSVWTDDILYIEGLREYVRICTEREKIITLLSMTRLGEVLPRNQFFRIHRSYIVNIHKILNIQGNTVTVGKELLPVSKGQKDDFLAFLNADGLF